GWNSLEAPAGTPREVIAFLNGHVRAIIGDPDFQKRMIELGGEPVTGSPEELNARLKSHAVMWADGGQKAGLDPNYNTHDPDRWTPVSRKDHAQKQDNKERSCPIPS